LCPGSCVIFPPGLDTLNFPWVTELRRVIFFYFFFLPPPPESTPPSPGICTLSFFFSRFFPLQQVTYPIHFPLLHRFLLGSTVAEPVVAFPPPRFFFPPSWTAVPRPYLVNALRAPVFRLPRCPHTYFSSGPPQFKLAFQSCRTSPETPCLRTFTASIYFWRFTCPHISLQLCPLPTSGLACFLTVFSFKTHHCCSWSVVLFNPVTPGLLHLV